MEGDQLNQQHKCRGRSFAWSVGFCAVVGGQFIYWSDGLSAGVGSCGIATFLIGSASVCLILCLAEISSAVPFNGGSFGFTRCTLGYYVGFLVGCCEIMEYLFATSSSMLLVGQVIASAYPQITHYQPMVWLLFYVFALIFQSVGHKRVVFGLVVLSLISLSIISIFCFGAIPYANLQNSAFGEEKFEGGFLNFLKILPLAVRLFMGCETISLCCDEVKSPKSAIPRNYAICAIILSVISIFCFLMTGVSGSMKLASKATFAFDADYSRIFNMPIERCSALVIPAIVATVCSFIFGQGKVISGMAASHLFPAWLKVTEEQGTPHVALIAACLLGYVICLLGHYVPFFGRRIGNIALMAALTVYIAQCCNFIQGRIHFKNLQKKFVSPLGIFGAVYPAVVYLLCLASLIALQKDSFITIIIFVALNYFLSVYYYVVAQSEQNMSDEERKVLYIAHIVKFNTAKTQAATKSNVVRFLPRRTSISYVDNNNSTSMMGTPKSKTTRVGSGSNNGSLTMAANANRRPTIEMGLSALNDEESNTSKGGGGGDTSWNIFSGDDDSSDEEEVDNDQFDVEVPEEIEATMRARESSFARRESVNRRRSLVFFQLNTLEKLVGAPQAEAEGCDSIAVDLAPLSPGDDNIDINIDGGPESPYAELVQSSYVPKPRCGRIPRSFEI